MVSKANHSGKTDEMQILLSALCPPLGCGKESTHLLDFLPRLDPLTTKNYLVLLYTRIGKLLSMVPGLSGTSTDFNVTSLLLTIYASAVSADGRITFPTLWTQVRLEGERLARQLTNPLVANESGRIEQKEITVVQRVAEMFEQVVDAVQRRNEVIDDWRKGQEWCELLQVWMGFYRVVSSTSVVFFRQSSFSDRYCFVASSWEMLIRSRN